MDILLKNKVNYQQEKFFKSLEKSNVERYRYALLVEQIAIKNLNPTDYISVVELEETLIWKDEFELLQKTIQEAKSQRFAGADKREALRKARKSKNVAPKGK